MSIPPVNAGMAFQAPARVQKSVSSVGSQIETGASSAAQQAAANGFDDLAARLSEVGGSIQAGLDDRAASGAQHLESAARRVQERVDGLAQMVNEPHPVQLAPDALTEAAEQVNATVNQAASDITNGLKSAASDLTAAVNDKAAAAQSEGMEELASGLAEFAGKLDQYLVEKATRVESRLTDRAQQVSGTLDQLRGYLEAGGAEAGEANVDTTV